MAATLMQKMVTKQSESEQMANLTEAVNVLRKIEELESIPENMQRGIELRKLKMLFRQLIKPVSRFIDEERWGY